MGKSREEQTLRLWIQIVRLANGLQKDVDSRLRREHGQSLARFDVLSQLHRAAEHQLSVGLLSASLLTPTNNITRLLDRMENDGLLVRRLSETDRRSFTVEATQAGLTLFKAMADDNRRWINDAFAMLSAGDLNALSKAIGVVESET